MKKLIIFLCVILFSGCNNTQEIAKTLNTTNDTSMMSEITDVPFESEQTSFPETVNIYSKFNGDYFTVDEKPLIIPAEEEWHEYDEIAQTNNEAKTGIYGDNYFINGTSYIRHPTGYCNNKYNIGEMERIETQWVSINEGEKIGTFTVENASAMYKYFSNVDAFYWNTLNIEFSGECKLEGIIFSYMNNLDSSAAHLYGSGIYFVPFPDSLKENDFPMMSQSQKLNGETPIYYFCAEDGYTIYGDTMEIRFEENSDEIIKRISDNLNTCDYFEAKVTIQTPELFIWSEDGRVYCNARLKDFEVIESSFATSENVSQEMIVKITDEADEIFIDNVKYLNNYNEIDFTINSESAMSNLIDLLVKSEKWQENFKLICTGMVDLEGEVFYQITLSTENDFSYSDIGIFWVNADNGRTYLKFDPTLDARGYFSEFSVNIPEDDYRTRLILFS